MKSWWLGLVVWLGLVSFAAGQSLLPNGMQQFSDGNGVPYANGYVYFYVPNTTTPAPTYLDNGLTTANANPVRLDANGRAIIWGTGTYRQVLQDQFGNTIWDTIVQVPVPSSNAISTVSFPIFADSSPTTVTSAFQLTQRIATGPIAYTLPVAATVFSGFGFWISNQQGGNVTVNPQSADAFQGQTAGQPLVIKTGQTVYISTNGGSPGTWYSSVSRAFQGGPTDAVANCFADPTGTNDSTAAIQSCITNYSTVYLPVGNFTISSCLVLPSGTNLLGAGQSETTITVNSSTVSGLCPAAAAAGIHLADFSITRIGIPSAGADGISVATSVSGMTIDRVTSANHNNGFTLGSTSGSSCNGCVAQFNYADGFSASASTGAIPLRWAMNGTLSQGNNGWGYDWIGGAGAGTSTIQVNWDGPQSQANTAGGFHFVGTSGNPISGVQLTGAVGLDDGGGNGGEVVLSTFGSQHTISGGSFQGAGQTVTGRAGSTAASHTGDGIHLSVNNTSVAITGTQVISNSACGIQGLGTLSELMVTGNQIANNGVSVACQGIRVASSAGTQVAVTGNSIFGNSSAQYGDVAGVVGIVSGNTFVGTACSHLGNTFTQSTTQVGPVPPDSYIQYVTVPYNNASC
jgi:hypothetical protein